MTRRRSSSRILVWGLLACLGAVAATAGENTYRATRANDQPPPQNDEQPPPPPKSPPPTIDPKDPASVGKLARWMKENPGAMSGKGIELSAKGGERMRAQLLVGEDPGGPAAPAGSGFKGVILSLGGDPEEMKALRGRLGPGDSMLVLSPVGAAPGAVRSLKMALAVAAAKGKGAGLSIVSPPGGGGPVDEVRRFLVSGTPEAQAAARKVSFYDPDARAKLASHFGPRKLPGIMWDAGKLRDALAGAPTSAPPRLAWGRAPAAAPRVTGLSSKDSRAAGLLSGWLRDPKLAKKLSGEGIVVSPRELGLPPNVGIEHFMLKVVGARGVPPSQGLVVIHGDARANYAGKGQVGKALVDWGRTLAKRGQALAVLSPISSSSQWNALRNGSAEEVLKAMNLIGAASGDPRMEWIVNALSGGGKLIDRMIEVTAASGNVGHVKDWRDSQALAAWSPNLKLNSPAGRALLQMLKDNPDMTFTSYHAPSEFDRMRRDFTGPLAKVLLGRSFGPSESVSSPDGRFNFIKAGSHWDTLVRSIQDLGEQAKKEVETPLPPPSPVYHWGTPVAAGPVQSSPGAPVVQPGLATKGIERLPAAPAAGQAAREFTLEDAKTQIKGVDSQIYSANGGKPFAERLIEKWDALQKAYGAAHVMRTFVHTPGEEVEDFAVELKESGGDFNTALTNYFDGQFPGWRNDPAARKIMAQGLGAPPELLKKYQSLWDPKGRFQRASDSPGSPPAAPLPQHGPVRDPAATRFKDIDQAAFGGKLDDQLNSTWDALQEAYGKYHVRLYTKTNDQLHDEFVDDLRASQGDFQQALRSFFDAEFPGWEKSPAALAVMRGGLGGGLVPASVDPLQQPDYFKGLKQYDTQNLLHLRTGEGKPFPLSKEATAKLLEAAKKDPKVQAAVADLTTGKVLFQTDAAGKTAYAASTLKAVVAAAFFNKLAEHGQTPTPDQYRAVFKLLVNSDNNVWDAVQRWAGGAQAVKAFADKLTSAAGVPEMFPARRGGNSGNALAELAFLKAVVNHEFPGADQLDQIMHACNTGALKGRKYLPSDVALAGKTGTYGASDNDMRFFQGPDGHMYGIVVNTQHGDKSAQHELVARLVGGLYRQYVAQSTPDAPGAAPALSVAGTEKAFSDARFAWGKLAERHIPAAPEVPKFQWGKPDAGVPAAQPAPEADPLPASTLAKIKALNDIVAQRKGAQYAIVERAKRQYTPEQRATMEKYYFEQAKRALPQAKEVAALVQYKDPKRPDLKVGEMIVWSKDGRKLFTVATTGSDPLSNGAPRPGETAGKVFYTNREFPGQRPLGRGPGFTVGRDDGWTNWAPEKYLDGLMVREDIGPDGKVKVLDRGGNVVYDIHPGGPGSKGCWTMPKATYKAFRSVLDDLTDRSVLYSRPDGRGGTEVGKAWGFLMGARSPDLGTMRSALASLFDGAAPRQSLPTAAPLPAVPAVGPGVVKTLPTKVFPWGRTNKDVPPPAATKSITASDHLDDSWHAAVAAIAKHLRANPTVVGLVVAAAQKYGVPPALALSVAQNESGFRQGAVSDAGARGVMQLMPGTARMLGVDPYSLTQNVEGGVRYIKEQLDAFHGDWRLAAAAYNAGPGAVQSYGGVPPYAETRAYARNVTALAAALGSKDNLARWADALVTPALLPDSFEKTLASLRANSPQPVQEPPTAPALVLAVAPPMRHAIAAGFPALPPPGDLAPAFDGRTLLKQAQAQPAVPIGDFLAPETPKVPTLTPLPTASVPDAPPPPPLGGYSSAPPAARRPPTFEPPPPPSGVADLPAPPKAPAAPEVARRPGSRRRPRPAPAETWAVDDDDSVGDPPAQEPSSMYWSWGDIQREYYGR